MRKIFLVAIPLAILCFQGCTAANVQTAARQQAPTYYGRPYEQLSAEEKMRLENHLTRQDTATWNTGAHVASGVGRFIQGVGVLILGAVR
jgi:hypothetical protein